MNQSEYTGFFAEFYDILHARNTDTKIYENILRKFGNDILELGCGTGRIAIPLAKAGYKVTGIEYEQEMIDILQQKEYPELNLKVYRGDARTFQLDQKFDVILLSCNFINHFINSDNLLMILKNSKKHLKDNGVIIIDCSAPDFISMIENNDVEEVFEFKTSKGTVIKDYFCAKYDLLNQIETDTIRLEEYDGGKLLRTAEINETLTYYLPREIRTLVSEANLNIYKESGCLWDKGKEIPMSGDAGEMIFYLKK